MKVKFLSKYEDTPTYYNEATHETINWLLSYDSHLLMVPGELADYALGHKLLTNSEAIITIMEPDKKVGISYGESAFLFFEPIISIGYSSKDGGFTKTRVISVKE